MLNFAIQILILFFIMTHRLTLSFSFAVLTLMVSAQPTADEVLNVARRANDYFMQKYEDPTVPTNVNKVRPSNLWTRAVYYEGLMALHDIETMQAVEEAVHAVNPRAIIYGEGWTGGTTPLNPNLQANQANR